MARGQNRFVIVGNVTGDPNVGSTQGGTKTVRLAITSERTWTDKDGKEQRRQEQHDVTLYGKAAEAAETKAKKGAKVSLVGRVEYDTKGDGDQKRKYTNLVADEIESLGSADHGGLNKVFLIGNLGADPEQRSTAGGGQIVRLSLATSRTVPNGQGGRDERTDWHDVSIFGKLGDIAAQFGRKGRQMSIIGRIEYNTSNDRKYTNIVAEDLTLLGGRDDEQGGSPPRASSGNASGGSQARRPAPAPAAQSSGWDGEGEDSLPF
jgi:single-strand DNA-binding protein